MQNVGIYTTTLPEKSIRHDYLINYGKKRSLCC